MKILVTGASGFIGSNIVERLVRDGHDVTALDNFHTGSEENLESVKGKIRLVRGSSGDVAHIGERFDVIFHQGVSSSSPMYKENPHLVAKAIDEWISILEYAKANNSRIVWAATSSVYNGHEPLHHERMDVKVTDFYTEARYEMERLAELYYKLYGVRSIGLRYFSVYSPHENAKKQYANLVTQFLWDLKHGRQPVVFGDGKQTRDFTYVDDIVEANMLAMKSAIPFGIYNAGTGKSITINDMIALLGRKLGRDVKPTYVENKIKNYVQHTLADTGKAERELGFRAKVSLEEGIGKLIDAYS